jgi:hypothetical protein
MAKTKAKRAKASAPKKTATDEAAAVLWASPANAIELIDWIVRCRAIISPHVHNEPTAAYREIGYFANTALDRAKTFASSFDLPSAVTACGQKARFGWAVADAYQYLGAAAEAAAGAVRPALNPTEQAIYEMLLALPPSAALRGGKILDRLVVVNPMLSTEQSTLTSRIIPKLRDHYGLESTEAGYRIKPSMRS